MAHHSITKLERGTNTKRIGAFTLLEVIVGAFILVTVLMGVAMLWQTHQRSFHMSRNRLIANYILQAEMERVLAGGFYGIPDRADAEPQEFQVRRMVNGTPQASTFTTEVAYETSTVSTMRKVLVTVSFEEQNRGLQTLTFESDVFWSH